MKYLLDTHALLWAVQAPERLSLSALEILRGEDFEVFVSIATPWELAIKANRERDRDRLDLAELLTNFERSILSAGYLILETTISHVIRAGLLPLRHRDPFDRLLVAQALELKIPVVSCDPVFDLYGVKRIWN